MEVAGGTSAIHIGSVAPRGRPEPAPREQEARRLAAAGRREHLPAAARAEDTIEEREPMRSSEVASLGQVSGALYEVGGIYRRNM